jgi:hypothetical protein
MPRLLPLLLVLICFCSWFDLSSAFLSQQTNFCYHCDYFVPSIRRSLVFMDKPSTKRKKIIVCAIVYGPDGKVISEEEEADEMLALATCDTVMKQLDYSTILLTRLACAFAPPPHDHLLPHQVVSTSLERVGYNHIDIAIAVPAGQVGSGVSDYSNNQLAQILVSVVLPEPVTSHGQKDRVSLVVGQMQQLEGVALERLSKRVNEEIVGRSQTAADSIAKQIEQQLTEAPKVADCPEWWTFSQKTATVQEEYKSLVNDVDFEHLLIDLCQKNYQGEPILQAKVASIGPAGIFLRARVEKKTDGVSVVDIPIPFPLGESTTNDELRENVIALIESSNVQEEVSRDDITESNDFVQSDATNSSETPPDTTASNVLKEEVLVLSNKTATASGKYDGVKQESIIAVRRQPKSTEEEERLAAKFAAIEDIGERAFEILKYLGMI